MRFLPLLLLITAAAPIFAEDKAADNVYRVDFTLRESGGGQPGQTKTRHYSVIVEANTWGRISAATKIPYQTGKDTYNYADIGVIIECRVLEHNTPPTPGPASLSAKFEVSSLATGGTLPTIHSVRAEASTRLRDGKPILVASMDDSGGEHHYEFDALVTKFK